MNEAVNLALICGTEAGEYDVLSILNKLRELSPAVSGCVFLICNGQGADGLGEAAASGAHRVVVYREDREHPSYTDFCETYIRENRISLLTFLDTFEGKELAAVLAVRLGGGLTADCIDITYDENGKFIFSRAALNDSVIAQIVCIHTDFQMCTVKKNALKTESVSRFNRGVIEEYDPPSAGGQMEQRAKVLSRVQWERKSSTQIQEAKKIFGFGRGIQSKDNLERLNRLARLCFAEVGGTRPCVEDELIDAAYQIGQSGISVSPDLYVAFGISGASQHLAGIQNTKVVISVNTDEEASIFQYSDYAVVEDAGALIDEMIQILEGTSK